MMRTVIAVSGACSLVERVLPTLREGEVLVRVAWSACNRADTLQRKGMYAPPPGATDVLGLEASGVVERTCAGGPPEGSRVMALLSGGGNAEWVAVPHAHLLRVPAAMPLRTAAAIPEVWLTAFQLLNRFTRVQFYHFHFYLHFHFFYNMT